MRRLLPLLAPLAAVAVLAACGSSSFVVVERVVGSAGRVGHDRRPGADDDGPRAHTAQPGRADGRH